ncbi:MAG: nucleotidyltransferase family protein [Holosporaceae bacterium]|jgi:NDP-sugar pyrophosphorylase family protein|nr:nucleotidyltransferase family protein [Holosporaceae bacterium]
MIDRGAERMLPVAMLAGGLAKRMRPITEKIPKALLPVAEEPFIFHQLRLLKKQGITRIVLCVGHLGELIEEQVGDGSKFGLEIAYSFDGPKLLGTAGALKKALPLLGDVFFVMYGDSYLTCNYSEVYRHYKKCERPALIAIYCNQNLYDISNIVFENEEIVSYDKKDFIPQMHYIDYGLSILCGHLLNNLKLNEFYDLADVYMDLVKKKKVAGFVARERFYEIGSPEGLNELSELCSILPSPLSA